MSDIIGGGSSRFEPFIVKHVQLESETIKSLCLVPQDGGTVVPFRPGQHLTIRLEQPGVVKPIIRNYSISSSPYELDHYRISVKRESAPLSTPEAPPGLASNMIHEQFSEGSTLFIKPPSGAFYLDSPAGTPVALISAGVGITPLLSMLLAVADGNTNQKTWFIHGSRNGRVHAFRDKTLRVAKEHGNITAHFCYSDPLESDVLSRDYHTRGRITFDLVRSLVPGPDMHFYLCGPGEFMNGMYNDLLDWGVPEENVRYESFGPSSVKRRKPETKAAESSTDMTVTFARSGKTLKWDPAFENILDFAEEHGLSPLHGCRGGMCHMCECSILDGAVRYPDKSLNPGYENVALICSSVPDGDVKLDI